MIGTILVSCIEQCCGLSHSVGLEFQEVIGSEWLERRHILCNMNSAVVPKLSCRNSWIWLILSSNIFRFRQLCILKGNRFRWQIELLVKVQHLEPPQKLSAVQKGVGFWAGRPRGIKFVQLKTITNRSTDHFYFNAHRLVLTCSILTLKEGS